MDIIQDLLIIKKVITDLLIIHILNQQPDSLLEVVTSLLNVYSPRYKIEYSLETLRKM